MPTPLHLEIKGLAKSNPAAYLSVDFVNTLMISKTLGSIERMKGKEIPVGQEVLSARLAHADYSAADFSKPPLTSPRVVKEADSLPNEIGLQLNSTIVIDVDIFVKGDSSKVISHVAVTLSGLVIRGSYTRNVVSFEGLDFKSSSNIKRTLNADTILKGAGIDPLEAARIEGVVGYSAVNNAISHALAQRKEIPLSETFLPLTSAPLLSSNRCSRGSTSALYRPSSLEWNPRLASELKPGTLPYPQAAIRL